MKKKVKRVAATKLSEEELKPVTIGFVDSKESSSISVFIIFGLLFAFAIFLPNIVEFVQNYGNQPSDSPSVTPNTPDSKPAEEKEMHYEDYTNDLVYEIEKDITVSQFTKSNNTLAFTIYNQSSKSFDMTTNRYFIELYSSEKTLLQRQILPENKIASNQSLDIVVNLDANVSANLGSILVTSKTVEDYPVVTLKELENRTKVLTCSRESQTLTYTFDHEDALQFITETIIGSYTTSTDATSVINEYQAYASRLNKIDGVDSAFASMLSGFQVITKVDYSVANSSQLTESYFYPKGTNPKVVQFELEADHYTCK